MSGPSMDLKKLAAMMRKDGATGVPQANTYVAAAHDSAMAGNTSEAEKLMQESVGNGVPDGEQMAKDEKSKAFMKALKKIVKKGK